jgi:hypothetical protein
MNYRLRVYPHNDLLNLAHYQLEVINNKKSTGVEDALGLDCMSCLISLAFSVEALINFVGHKKISDWQERQDYKSKITKVCTLASLPFIETVEPFKTLKQLKELRDSIAHGKPFEVAKAVISREELRRAMECPWDKHLTPEYVGHAYDMVKEFERQLFRNCKIEIDDTLTSAAGCRN